MRQKGNDINGQIADKFIPRLEHVLKVSKGCTSALIVVCAVTAVGLSEIFNLHVNIAEVLF